MRFAWRTFYLPLRIRYLVDSWIDALIAGRVACWPARSRRYAPSFIDDSEDIFLAHDEDIALVGAVLELIAGPQGKEDCVPLADLERPAAAILHHAALANRDNLAFLGFALGVVRQNDAPG